MTNNKYTIELLAGIKPVNDGTYPMVRAQDIEVNEETGKRLTEIISNDGETLKIGSAETEALGDYSLAIGYNKNDIATKSIGIASAAIGKGVQSYGDYSFVSGCQNFTGLTEEEKEKAYQYAGVIKDQETQKYRIMTEDELSSVKNSTGKNIQLPTEKTEDNIIKYKLNIDEDLFLEIQHAYKSDEIYKIKPWSTSAISKTDFEGGYIFGTLGQNTISGGYGNRSVGQSAFSHGQANMALGNRTFALGTNNRANSKENIAIGTSNVIGNPLYYDGNENNIIAIGNNLTSHTSNQIILGRHNKEDSEAILIVGNGSSSNKKNIFSLSNNNLLYGSVPIIVETSSLYQYYQNLAFYNNNEQNFVLIFSDSSITEEYLKNKIIKINLNGKNEDFFFLVNFVWENSYSGNGLNGKTAIRLVRTSNLGDMTEDKYNEIRDKIVLNPFEIVNINTIEIAEQPELSIENNNLLYNGNIIIKDKLNVAKKLIIDEIGIAMNSPININKTCAFNSEIIVPDDFIENIWS